MWFAMFVQILLFTGLHLHDTAGTSGAATIGTTCRMIIITITTTIITMMMQG